MAYQYLNIPSTTPPNVKALVHHIESLSFSDVHSMLRLPIHNYVIHAGCNFAIAHVLMAVIGGVSTALYHSTGKVGERFTGVLVDYFPWNLEPHGSVSPKDGADAIYEVFRNPLTHDLGLDLKKKSAGLKVKFKRLKTSTRTGTDRGLTERQIELLERSQARPNTSATVTLASDKRVLLIEGLYWGLRRMIERLTADQKRMSAAEQFLVGL
jgi:hypothetical protein